MKVGKTSAPRRRRPRQETKDDQYVELSASGTDRIFVILAEFGDERHPSYPDQDTDPDIPGPTTFDGPLHNAIPEPTGPWTTPPSGSPTTTAALPGPLLRRDGRVAARPTTRRSPRAATRSTARSPTGSRCRTTRPATAESNGFPCDSNVCSNTWALVRDAANQWVADQLPPGRTEAQVKADMESFDQWDRYDYDGDGNFNEPDGYIDHFQIVHAGGDQADGDPHQGEDAIWSHRWYAYAPTPA